MGCKDIFAHTAQGKDVDSLVVRVDSLPGRNIFTDCNPMDIKIFLVFQGMEEGKKPGNCTLILVAKGSQ